MADKEYMREWRTTHPGYNKAQLKRHRENNPNYARESWTKYSRSAKGRATSLVTGIAKRQEITVEEKELLRTRIREAIEFGYCEATGLAFCLDQYADGHTHPRAPSVDRIDSAGGYTLDNVQIVCAQYNFAKNEWGQETLLELAEAIVKNDRK